VRAALCALALALAAAGGARAGGAVPALPGEVHDFAADGPRVVMRTYDLGLVRSCDDALVWNVRTGAVVRLTRRCFPTDESSAYVGLGIGGGRLAWVNYSYGNNLYCNGPFTTTVARRRPVDLGVCDPNAGDNMQFEFAGDGDLLVVVSFVRCFVECDGPPGDYDVSIGRVEAGRIHPVLAAHDLRTLAGVDAGRIAVLDAGGHVLVVDRRGRTVNELQVPAAAEEARLSGPAVVVRVGRYVESYELSSGERTARRRIAARASLTDVHAGLAAYVTVREVHVLRLADGRDRVVARAENVVDAEIERLGLAWAARERVGFVPVAALR